MWVQLTEFAVDPSLDDRAVLAALVESPGYAHDYASPFDHNALVTEPAVHGRWWRSSIGSELFEPCAAEKAAEVLQDWADDQDWVDPTERRSGQPFHAVTREGHADLPSPPG